ncbi:MAG: FadR/GntR family transcriptional regulator [Actinomycetes bacterium]
MSDALRPLDRPRLYEQLVQRLREHVAEAGLQAGDRLPSERELAERLGVSRNTLKQAIVVLEVQGLIEIRRGGGTYLRTDDLPAESLATLLERKQRLPDVLEARDALETKLAALAATRRTDDDLVVMTDALADMRQDTRAGGLGDEGDRRFHVALSAAARSAILSEFYRQLTPQITESRLESLRQPGRPSQSLAQHLRVLDAIRAGDPVRAGRAMHRHLSTVSDVRLLSWAVGSTDH